MFKNVKKNSQGFTIIEVLIVLAIAGLIMLVVFLAVPALQRNSRNTRRKQDVAAILGSLSEWISNNNGSLPATTCTGATPCAFFSNFTPAIYDKTTATGIIYTVQNSRSTLTAVTDADVVKIYTFAKCSGTAPTDTGATARSVIALYAVESGGGTTAQCSES